MVASYLQGVSDTALIIAYIRGNESQKKDAKFIDPLAAKLSGERAQSLAGTAQKTWSSRLLSGGLQNSVVVRTVLIDELIHKAVHGEGIKRVINLGAGLDARPYRMDLPSDLEWVEVDLSDMISYKKLETENFRSKCKVQHISCDLSVKGTLEELLKNDLASEKTTLILTEGLLVYLKDTDVEEMSELFKNYSYIQKWVTDVYSPFSIKLMKQVWSRQLGKQVQFFFCTKDSTSYFTQRGWSVKDSLPVFDHNERIGRTSRLNGIRKVLTKILGGKFKNLVRRSSIVVSLERQV